MKKDQQQVKKPETKEPEVQKKQKEKTVKRHGSRKEKQFEDKVKTFLTDQGNWFIKYWGGAAFTKAGVPDLLVCCFGQFMGLELKADKGEPTLLQLKTLEKIRKSGGWGILLYPGDFQAFQKWYGDRMKGKAWYLDNIKLQETWIKRIEERSSKDGSKEEGTA